MQEKQRCTILLFLFFEPFPLPVRFSLLSKYLLWEKYCHYPLITTQGDRFTSCENIVSRSQTSSLLQVPPQRCPPAYQLFSKCPASLLVSFWCRASNQQNDPIVLLQKFYNSQSLEAVKYDLKN